MNKKKKVFETVTNCTSKVRNLWDQLVRVHIEQIKSDLGYFNGGMRNLS
jgi:phenylpyruvate tautomerase PptA (4-oxalocrotonate tautomerase family)